MYSKIHNPKTNRNVSIYSTLGKKILKSYLQKLGITGGSNPDDVPPNPETLFGSLLNKKVGLNQQATAQALALHDFRIGDRVQVTNDPVHQGLFGFIITEPKPGWFLVRLDGHDNMYRVWHRDLSPPVVQAQLQYGQPGDERVRNAFHGPGIVAPPHLPQPVYQGQAINIGDRVQITADGEMANVYGMVNNIYRAMGDRMNTIVILPDGDDREVHIYEAFVVPAPHPRNMYGGPGAVDPRS